MIYKSKSSRLGGVDRSVNMDKDNEEKNAYEVVGIGSDATEADIKKAFRQRSLKTHPDRVRCALCSILDLSLCLLPTQNPHLKDAGNLHLSECHF
jgi:DnaJ domain